MLCPNCQQTINYFKTKVTFSKDENGNAIFLCPKCQAELIIKEPVSAPAPSWLFIVASLFVPLVYLIKLFGLNKNQIIINIFFVIGIISALVLVFLLITTLKRKNNSIPEQVKNKQPSPSLIKGADGLTVALKPEDKNPSKTAYNQVYKKLGIFIIAFLLIFAFLTIKNHQSLSSIFYAGIAPMLGVIITFIVWGTISYYLRNKNGGLIIGLLGAIIIGGIFIVLMTQQEERQSEQARERQSQIEFDQYLQNIQNGNFNH